MGLIVLVVACALAVGWLLGGRLAALADLPVRSWQLLMSALLAQVAGALGVLVGLPAGPTNTVALVVTGLLVGLFCVRNGVLHGIALIGLGLLANGVVIAVNGAMPVSRHAADRAGVEWRNVVDDARHEPATHDTTLRSLGDIIPVPLPGRPEVVSVGDVFVAAGVAQFLLNAMLWATPGRTGPGTGPPPDGDGNRQRRPGPSPWQQRRRPVDERTAAGARRPRRRQASGRTVDADSELVRVIISERAESVREKRPAADVPPTDGETREPVDSPEPR